MITDTNTDTKNPSEPTPPHRDRGVASLSGTVPSLRELRHTGRELRSRLRRRDHAELTLPERDPVAILQAQNTTRLADLVPVRIGRMLQSPFAYYRGIAGVMAHDLTASPVTGTQVVCCGDAHISNFGLFASPERRLIFDLNDFDEASNAPWEWDVKRFAASIVVGGRDKGLSDKKCLEVAQEAVSRYRETLHEMFELSALERFYFQIDTDWMVKQDKARVGLVRRSADKARRRTSEQVLGKLTVTTEAGARRIVDNPPLTRHVDHIGIDTLSDVFAQYVATLRADVALLLSQFTLADFALRVVGVGSVGTRCYVALFIGPSGEPLFLQIKEAASSVLETHGGHHSRFGVLSPADTGRQGFRVVAGQRILQAQSDPFLGWARSRSNGSDGIRPADFYFRQFRDMKGSLDTADLSSAEYRSYVLLCARLLARAHSQSPDAAVVSGYLGNSDRFDEAIARWSMAYADRTERDFEALGEAVRRGRLPAEYDI